MPPRLCHRCFLILALSRDSVCVVVILYYQFTIKATADDETQITLFMMPNEHNIPYIRICLCGFDFCCVRDLPDIAKNTVKGQIFAMVLLISLCLRSTIFPRN